MRKLRRTHIALVILFLSAVLAGQVGSHLLHHHEGKGSSTSSTIFKDSSTALLISGEENCALCKLDLFPIQEYAVAALLTFVASYFVVYTIANETEISNRSFFKQSRGPPTFIQAS
jgi:hypothetical protein